jgi:Immunity protein 53
MGRELGDQAEGDPVRFLELWCHAQCVDDRELGVLIEAVDGPGWWISIDLRATNLEGRTLKASVEDHGSGRWQQSWSDGRVFTVASSILQLGDALSAFRQFALSNCETASTQVGSG